MENTVYLHLNGDCHKQKVFSQDLVYQLQGKKLIKSIQDRLIRAKDYLAGMAVKYDPTMAYVVQQ